MCRAPVPLGSELSSQTFQDSMSVHISALVLGSHHSPAVPPGVIFLSVIAVGGHPCERTHPGYLFGQIPLFPDGLYAIVSPGPYSEAWVHIMIPISRAHQSVFPWRPHGGLCTCLLVVPGLFDLGAIRPVLLTRVMCTFLSNPSVCSLCLLCLGSAPEALRTSLCLRLAMETVTMAQHFLVGIVMLATLAHPAGVGGKDRGHFACW